MSFARALWRCSPRTATIPTPDPIVVVGGGPAGSATALRLARQGHAVTLLDRARFPRDKCCSEYGAPGTIRELASLGVLDTLIRHGVGSLVGTRVTGAGGSTLIGRFAAAAVGAQGMALPRLLLDHVLLNAAREAGVTIHESTRFLGTERVAGLMRSTVEHAGTRREITSRVVIGADGIRSRVARALDLAHHGGLRRIAFVAHCDGVAGMSNDAELHAGQGAYIGLNPLGGGRTNVAVVVDAARVRQAMDRPDAFVQAELARFPAVAARVDGATIARGWLVTGPFDVRARRSAADGCLLVGDAADFFDPFTGEGIGAALTGAILATETLDEVLRSDAPITAARLAGYRTARRRQFAGKWAVERLIGHAMRFPRFFDRCIGRIERRGMAATLIGVTGDVLPTSRVLNPLFLARMVA